MLGLLLAATLGLPAPAAQVAPGRQLVYSFAAGPTVGNHPARTSNGKLNVAVVGRAPDGNLLVQMQEQFAQPWYQNRPQPKIEVELAPDGSLKYTQAPYGISASERAVLPFLATTFYQSGRSSWSRNYEIDAVPYSYFTTLVTETLKASPGSDDTVKIALDGVVRAKSKATPLTLATVVTTAGTVVYDLKSGIPTSVSETFTRRNNFHQQAVELQLLSDTLATR